MGLDSVELLQRFEDYFGISFPDALVQKVENLQQMVALVARYKGIGLGQPSSLKLEMLAKINSTLQQMGLVRQPLKAADHVFQVLPPQDAIRWEAFCKGIQLEVPKPVWDSGHVARWLKWMEIGVARTDYDWKVVTLDQFASVICAANHAKLIRPDAISDDFQIYCALVALTVNEAGLDFYQIDPQKSFSNGYGID